MIKACIDCFPSAEQRRQVRATGRTKVDGKIVAARPAPCPGPRCATHGRIHSSEAKLRAHAARVIKTYGLSGDEYWALYRFQGEVCAICGRSKGLAKRLAVDHDHKTGHVRMLACSKCNKLLGMFRDAPAALRRAAEALEDPPAVRAVGWRRNESEGSGELMEIWRDVPDYEGWYQCSSLGRVRSWKGVGGNQYSEPPRAREPRIIHPGETRGGYLSAGLSMFGRVRSFRVNRLVLLTFEGPPSDPDMHACHRDGVRTNNRLDNLYWGTVDENQADKVRHGTQVAGELVASAKLTAESVVEVRRLWATGEYSVLELAAQFGVSGPTLWKAATGKTWRKEEG